MEERNRRKRADKSEWRSNKPRTSRKIMMDVAQAYDAQITAGKSREAVLVELSEKYDRNKRTIERWVAYGRDELEIASRESETTIGEKEHKEYPKEVRKHDVRIFEESDGILDENKLDTLIDRLIVGGRFYSYEGQMLIDFLKFFDKESNKYVSSKIREQCER